MQEERSGVSSGLPGQRVGRARWASLTVLCVAVLMVNLDNTILNVALPTLVEKLQATTDQLQWIVDAYSMVFGGLLLVAGSVADRYGRKRLFLAGLAVFGSGSLGAAFSGSVGPLIAWRGLMGAGAAMTMSIASCAAASVATCSKSSSSICRRSDSITNGRKICPTQSASDPFICSRPSAH